MHKQLHTKCSKDFANNCEINVSFLMHPVAQKTSEN